MIDFSIDATFQGTCFRTFRRSGVAHSRGHTTCEMCTFDGVHIMMSQQFKTDMLDEPEAQEREKVHKPISNLRQ